MSGLPIPEMKVMFNPACSKCRSANSILDERGVDATYVHYLEQPPTVEELEDLLTKLGETDPRAIVRRGEAPWTELGLENADDRTILEAMTTHPILIERPIVVLGDRAVVARPPERLLELLDD